MLVTFPMLSQSGALLAKEYISGESRSECALITARVRYSDVCVCVALCSRMLGNTQGRELGVRGRDVRI